MKPEFIKLLQPQNIFQPKKRLGPAEDGGYVFPEFVFNACSALYTYGISNDSRFEEAFTREYNKPAYLFDHTIRIVDPNRIEDQREEWRRHEESWKTMNCHFYPTGLGFQENCHDFITDYESIGTNGPVILKIDIEGGEYEYFQKTIISKMEHTVMAISLEVHWINNDKNRADLIDMLKALNPYFILCHVHGNNWGDLWKFEHQPIPVTLELTFINRKFVEKYEPDTQKYPIVGLDIPNNSQRQDYDLSFLNDEKITNVEDIKTFTEVYNTYGFLVVNNESRSGNGSTLKTTENIRAKIVEMVHEKGIKSVVDIPCGDFNWMKEIVNNFESYIGGDIVEECIKTNNEKYENFGHNSINFMVHDLLTDPIPRADLLIVRDMMGHYTLDDGRQIIKNILNSNCKYLLATSWYNINDKTYYKRHVNENLPHNGRWYGINLMSKPFNLPEPEYIIEEDSVVDDYHRGIRKILGLWNLEDMRRSLPPSEVKYAAVAIYGSHNSSISLAINDEIVEVIEIERLVGKKNASLFYYPPTIINNTKQVLDWISDRFKTKYGIDEYDVCLHDMVDMDVVKRYFPSKKYIQVRHHESHGYGSLYQSPHNAALVLSYDGGGNDGWFVIYRAERNANIVLMDWKNVNYGVCYGMVGHYLKTLKHESSYLIGNLVYAGKLMGLAGYGKVRNEWVEEFTKWYQLETGLDHETLFKEMLIRLNIPLDENNLASEEDSKDLAATSQFVFEESVLNFLKPHLDSWRHLPVHFTGGGGLNILLNTRLSNMGHEVFIAPNPNDCGLTVGMLLGHIMPSLNKPADVTYAGLEVLDPDALLDYTVNETIHEGTDLMVDDLAKGKIVGTVIGRSEHGPRALGNRSILCNPSTLNMKDTLNAKVKHREWYRPFAPVVRLEDVNEYFEWNKPSRWMSFCPKVRPEYREKLQSITHVDGTARVQTVTREENAWLYDLITKFKEKTGFGVLLNTSFNVAGKPILNTYKDAFEVYRNSEMDGLFLEDKYIRKSEENISMSIENVNVNVEKKNLTVVTGLWNIGRPNRSFDEYIEQFKKVLDIDCNLFVYIPKEYEHIVWEKRQKHNTYVKVYELQDIRDMIGDWWGKMKTIRQTPEWYNQADWLVGSPQATLEWYNPIVMSKYSLLHNTTVWNPFNTDYFVWLDAGITFTVYEKYFTENKILDKIIPYLDTFLFLSYPYETNNEIHGFKYSEMVRNAGQEVKYVCRGGLFGGHKDIIHEGNGTYWHLVNKTLSDGLMGTEESIFTIMAYNEPHTYRRYSLDGNGLIVKFAAALADDTVVLEPTPERNKYTPAIITNRDLGKVKTNLYILTFNFPQQITHTISSMQKVPEWLSKPHLVLIDNSTSHVASQDFAEIAKKYNMEYIRMGSNTGICGGRQKAAEHFHESDADYMFFFEDDMTINSSELEGQFCRNGFRKHITNLYDIVHKIIMKENFDFVKLSFTEVYFDNDKSLPWYNVPQNVRSRDWPDYDKLPITGLDANSPQAKYTHVNVCDGVTYMVGEVNYCNWPMIVSKSGNQKMFIDTKWANPFEQTWSSHVYNLMKDGKVKAAILLASPIWHDRISHYTPQERREN